MGAVNYYTSDYITMGLVPYSVYDFEQDTAFMRELQEEVKEYGGTVEEALNSYISDCYDNDRMNIENELEKHNFYYYHITIKPGYYEGFTLDIENNFPIALDRWEDRRNASKEITEIKQFLIECAGFGLVQCSPGWCARYNDYKGTIKAIKAAIKKMRDELRTIPTVAQYNRAC